MMWGTSHSLQWQWTIFLSISSIRLNTSEQQSSLYRWIHSLYCDLSVIMWFMWSVLPWSSASTCSCRSYVCPWAGREEPEGSGSQFDVSWCDGAEELSAQRDVALLPLVQDEQRLLDSSWIKTFLHQLHLHLLKSRRQLHGILHGRRAQTTQVHHHTHTHKQPLLMCVCQGEWPVSLWSEVGRTRAGSWPRDCIRDLHRTGRRPSQSPLPFLCGPRVLQRDRSRTSPVCDDRFRYLKVTCSGGGGASPGTWTPYTLASLRHWLMLRMSETSVVATFSPFHLCVDRLCYMHTWGSQLTGESRRRNWGEVINSDE